MHDICEKSGCTGCSACANICKFSAISMLENEKGFFMPVVDYEKCTDCGMCIKKCPQNNSAELKNSRNVYATLVRDDELRKVSSSGGIFSALANAVLNNKGIIYGAALCENLSVKHVRIENKEDLVKLRGSKYVESEIGFSYKNVLLDLNKNLSVLFSGTPCQIAGLYAFLGKDYDDLVTVDILCHGVPSRNVFRKYIIDEQKDRKSEITNVNFRNKATGWRSYSLSLSFADSDEKREVYFQNRFMNGFLKNYYLGESCYNCKYAKKERIGDITLGDFWGYKETSPDYIENDDHGISLVMINSEKGEKLFKSIRKNIDFCQSSIEKAKKENPILNSPSVKPDNYDDFWNDYRKISFFELSEKYFPCKNDYIDWMSKEDREYFNLPYNKRHIIHVLRCKKNNVMQKLKGN